MHRFVTFTSCSEYPCMLCSAIWPLPSLHVCDTSKTAILSWFQDTNVQTSRAPKSTFVLRMSQAGLSILHVLPSSHGICCTCVSTAHWAARAAAVPVLVYRHHMEHHASQAQTCSDQHNNSLNSSMTSFVPFSVTGGVCS